MSDFEAIELLPEFRCILLNSGDPRAHAISGDLQRSTVVQSELLFAIVNEASKADLTDGVPGNGP